jgi:preprotein translocase subunit SecG
MTIPFWVTAILTVLFLFVCVLLMLAVLIQRPAGGGLSGAFGSGAGSGQTAFGAKTGDALTIATIAIFFVYICFAVGLNYAARPQEGAVVTPTANGTTGATGGSASTGAPAASTPAAPTGSTSATGATSASGSVAPSGVPATTAPTAPTSPSPAAPTGATAPSGAAPATGAPASNPAPSGATGGPAPTTPH